MGGSNWLWLLVLGILVAVPGPGTGATGLRGADDRFKMDILVVVAHPDDEGGVTPYLARAIYDLHKRVAVVYGTRGGSGGNEYSRERGPALANIREMEAREACARLGITNVWFLDGKDTASQNVLNSLSNWGHGENLERLVGMIRLTRPEVIIAPLPGMFIGENHGDHQAAGVLATEAFDLAARPAMFPSQLGTAAAKARNLPGEYESLAAEETVLRSGRSRRGTICRKRACVLDHRGFAFAEKTVLAARAGRGDDPPDAVSRRDSCTQYV